MRTDSLNTTVDWSLKGKMGALLAFAMLASVSGDYRVPIGGLLVHVYLLLLVPAIFIGKVYFWNVPRKIFMPLLVLVGVFSVSLLREANIGEIVKIVSGIVTFLFFTQVVRSDKDFRIASLGFIAVSLFVATSTFFVAQEEFSLNGVNALTGIGNKNAQSLYTLPGLFFLCHSLSSLIQNKKFLWLGFWLIAFLIILGGIAYTGNRSGYVGAFIIVFMTVYQNFRSSAVGVIIVLAGLIGGIWFLQEYNADSNLVAMMEHKWNQTTTGYTSDDYRKQLIFTSLRLGFTNPVLGLGMTGLFEALAQEVVHGNYAELDSHNVYGYVIGAAGIFAFLAFWIFFYNLARMSFRYNRLITFFGKEKHLAFWCIAFIILYLIRSLFTRETMYSPSMMGGMGLIFGLLLYRYKEAKVKLLQLLYQQRSITGSQF